MTGPDDQVPVAALLDRLRGATTWTEMVDIVRAADDAVVRRTAEHLGMPDVAFRDVGSDLATALREWGFASREVGGKTDDEVAAELRARLVEPPAHRGEARGLLLAQLREDIVAGRPWNARGESRREVADPEADALHAGVVGHAEGMLVMLTDRDDGVMAKLPVGTREWLAAAKLATLYQNRIDDLEPPAEAWQDVKDELGRHAASYGDPQDLPDGEDPEYVASVCAAQAASLAAQAAQHVPYAAAERAGDSGSLTDQAMDYADSAAGGGGQFMEHVAEVISDKADEQFDGLQDLAGQEDEDRRKVLLQVAEVDGVRDMREQNVHYNMDQLETAVRQGMLTTGYLDEDGQLRTDGDPRLHHVLTLTDAGRDELARLTLNAGAPIPPGAPTCPKCGAPVILDDGNLVHRVQEQGRVSWIVRPCPPREEPSGDAQESAAPAAGDQRRCTATLFVRPHAFEHDAGMTGDEARGEWEMCDKSPTDPIHDLDQADEAVPVVDTVEQQIEVLDVSSPDRLLAALIRFRDRATMQATLAHASEDRHRVEIAGLEGVMQNVRDAGLSAEHLSLVVDLRNAYAEACRPLEHAHEAAATMARDAQRCVNNAQQHVRLQAAGAAGRWYQGG